MKIGMLGAGSIGARHVRAFRDAGADVCAVASRSFDGAQAFARTHGAMEAYATLAEMIDAVEVVCVCTPTDLHLAQAIQCFDAGRDVFCEKPLARSSMQARAMAQAAAATGRQLFPMHVLRWFQHYADAQARAARREFGTLKTLSLERRGTRPTSPTGSWFEDESRSGGVLMDLLIHDIDYALWLAGPAHEVRANYTDPLTIELAIKHTNGVLSQLSGSWRATHFATNAAVFGETGSHLFDSSMSDEVDPYLGQAAELMHCQQTRSSARVSTEDAIAALVVVEAAVASVVGGGKPVAPST